MPSFLYLSGRSFSTNPLLLIVPIYRRLFFGGRSTVTLMAYQIMCFLPPQPTTALLDGSITALG